MIGIPSFGSGLFQSKSLLFACLKYKWLTTCSGAWIVASAWMAYDFGTQILSGLEQAAGLPQKKTQ
jgi:hypothetical protein